MTRKKDKNIDLKIIECAKLEFIEKGFIDASLRNIAKNASVTTGSIYTRYDGKNELFEDVISPFIKMWEKFSDEMYQLNIKRLEENNLDEMFGESDYMEKLVKILYQEFDLTKIFFCKSNGSKFENYLDNVIDDNFDLTYKFIKKMESAGYQIGITKKEYKTFLTVYWKAVFEVIISDFTYNEALSYLNKLKYLFSWEKIIGEKIN